MKLVPLPRSTPSVQKGELHECRLVHKTSRRERYRFRLLLNDPDLSVRIERRLAQESAIRRAEARWTSGSLILERHAEQEFTADDLARCLEEALASILPPPETPGTDLVILDAEHRDQTGAAHLRRWLELDAAGVLAACDVSLQSGLSARAVEEHRQRWGANQVHEVPPSSRWLMFQRQFANTQTALLAGSAGLSLLTGGFFDVLMIGGVVLVNGYIGYLSEVHAEEVIDSIGRIEPQDVQVLRDGRRTNIQDFELVVGDLVFVGVGVVPADIRLIESKGLMVDESPLTGESMPVAKHHEAISFPKVQTISDRANLVFRGTIVTSGQGLGVVIATGEQTEIGEVRRLVATTSQQPSLLERDLSRIGQQTIAFSSVVCGGVFLVGLARGHGWLEMLKTSISLAVAAVPEGLPTIGTTTMALGVSSLQKRNVIARRLNVMETLGSIQVLCLDKTGTLTINDMVAQEGYFGLSHWTLPKLLKKPDTKAPVRGADGLTARTWKLVASLCSDCEWLPAVNGHPARWSGSATEKALIEMVEALGAEPLSLRRKHRRFKVSYRTEQRHYMVTYHKRDDSDKNLAAVKGSPEQLIELCGWWLDQGEIKELDADVMEQIKKQNRDLGKKGLRVLGFAYLESQDMHSIRDQRLIWIGLVGLMDPMREGMAELIGKFHKAGIRTIMMTGDQTSTAKAVGKALGFNGQGGQVKTVDARLLQALSLEEIARLTEDVQVFSRVSPSDKLRIVQALQGQGKIVAMTGDGINDSPALKAAHVGIAMGFQGTSAARESADIVLKDDNLEVLFDAIEQGRAIHSNLRKSIKYLLGTNLSEILLMFGAIAAGRGSPLSPIQLLWINLLSDVLPGLALALDPPGRNTMRQTPPDPCEPILPADVQKKLVLDASMMACAAFLAHRSGASGPSTQAQASTAAFVALTLSQILHTLSASVGDAGIVQTGLPRNRRIYVAMGIAVGTIALGTLTPFLQRVLGMSSLSTSQWARSIGHGLWPLVLSESIKYLESQSSVTGPTH